MLPEQIASGDSREDGQGNRFLVLALTLIVACWGKLVHRKSSLFSERLGDFVFEGKKQIMSALEYPS